MMGLLKISISTVASVVTASVYSYKRKAMKRRDKEIKEERERERKIERRPREIALKHFLHNCPLKEFHCSTDAKCHACGTRVLGWAYTCAGDCEFFLHEACAKNPVTLSPCMYSLSQQTPSPTVGERILRTFAHVDHPVKENFSNVGYKCKQCLTQGNGKRFRCSSCTVDLHPVCATNPTKISSYMHPVHELELKTRRYFKNCAICRRAMGPNVRLYRCKTCKFYVHPACTQLPQYPLHDLHPLQHPLQLKTATSRRRCDAKCVRKCGKGKWSYECKICDVSFHVACVLKHSIHGMAQKGKRG